MRVIGLSLVMSVAWWRLSLRIWDGRERASREGFDGYLGKPISVRTLPSQVGEFLSNGRADVR